MGPEGPRLTRRGPGRPPFRKAQSAACMEISLPVSHTEGVCLSTRLPSVNPSNLPLLLTGACHARTPGVSGLRPDAWLTHGKPMLMQVASKHMVTKGLHCKTTGAGRCCGRVSAWRLRGHGFDLQQGHTNHPASRVGLGPWSRSRPRLWTGGLLLGVWKLMG